MAKSDSKLVKNKMAISPFLVVIISFIVMIFIGSFLLACPFCRLDHQWTSNYMGDFFSALSATCVTGLSTYADGISNVYNTGGEVVMLICIQIGGLSFITLLAFVVTLFSKRMSMKNRLFLAQAVNATSLGDMVRFVRNVIIITFTVEIIGAFLLFPSFFYMFKDTEYGLGHTIWVSIFQAVSTFCNAGFDLLGGSSYIVGAGNSLIDNLYNNYQWAYIYLECITMVLIVFGAMSFLVIMDLFSPKKYKRNRILTRVVLCTTGFLIVVGTGLLCLTEMTGNGSANFMQCLFQSITCRTAGYANISQADLTPAGKAISCILMFIGGSPTSTAGGIKTTTIFVVVVSIYKSIRGKQFVVFNRKISYKSTTKAMSLMVIGLFIVLLGYISIASFESGNPDISQTDIIYETFSGFGTVGVSTGITPYLSLGSQITLCVLMFLGRVGAVTVLQVFNKDLEKEEKLHYSFVEADILIG